MTPSKVRDIMEMYLCHFCAVKNVSVCYVEVFKAHAMFP